MAMPVVEFSREGYKIVRFSAKNQHTHRKLLNFANWCQNVPKFDFQSQFSMSKIIIRIFLIFFPSSKMMPNYVSLENSTTDFEVKRSELTKKFVVA